MLISIKVLSKAYEIKPFSVAHVGAHHAEEFSEYKKHGWGKVFWFEAIAENINAIRDVIGNSGDEIINAAVWSTAGKILDFNIASNSQATSVLDFGQHSSLYPNIVKIGSRDLKSTTLDIYFENKIIPEFINLDVQGAELEVLKGFSKSLHKVKWVYTEINKKEIYKNCALVEDIDNFLSQYGFTRLKTRWVLNHGWGDALYVKEEMFKQNLKSMTYELFDWLKWNISQVIYSTKLTFHKFLRKWK